MGGLAKGQRKFKRIGSESHHWRRQHGGRAEAGQATQKQTGTRHWRYEGGIRGRIDHFIEVSVSWGGTRSACSCNVRLASRCLSSGRCPRLLRATAGCPPPGGRGAPCRHWRRQPGWEGTPAGARGPGGRVAMQGHAMSAGDKALRRPGRGIGAAAPDTGSPLACPGRRPAPGGGLPRLALLRASRALTRAARGRMGVSQASR